MGDEVEIRQDGLVKVGGIPLCRRVVDCDGHVVIEVTPRAKNSNACRDRGGKPATVELSKLVEALETKTP